MRAFGLVLIVMSAAFAAGTSHKDEITKFRQDRETRLVSDTGWTTVSGLYWLKPGLNKFASLAAPVEFLYEKGIVKAKYKGKWQTLRADVATPANAAEDKLVHASLTMAVIERDGRQGIRVRDTNSKYRRSFTGLKYFPVKPAYKVEARWIPYAQPKKVVVNTVIDGIKESYEATGQVEFTLGGRKLKLEPVVDGDELFYIFRDLTTGKSTYGAGRFLYSPLAKNGKVTIDFNKSYNPPCAFTPYATCPLPPPQNRLAAAVEAGELTYHLSE
jgi:uncharacterized protein